MLFFHFLSGTNIERYVLPSFIIKIEFYCSKGLCIGIPSNAVLLAVSFYFNTVYCCFSILASYRIMINLIGRDSANTFQNINFTIPDLTRLQ